MCRFLVRVVHRMSRYDPSETRLCVPLIYLSSWAIHLIKQILLQHKKWLFFSKQFWPHVMYMLQRHNKKTEDHLLMSLFSPFLIIKKSFSLFTRHLHWNRMLRSNHLHYFLYNLQMQILSTINNTIKCTQKDWQSTTS